LTEQCSLFEGFNQELLSCSGHPEIEDTVASRILEFWNSFSEHVEDCIGEGATEHWIQFANQQLVEMCGRVCAKIRIPPTWDTMTEEEKKSVRGFRVDCRDLLQSCSRIVGSLITEMFCRQAVEACSRQDWTDLEVALYCLTALGFAEDPETDPYMINILDSPIYTVLLSETHPQAQRTRKTAIDLLGCCTVFFKRNNQYLADALNFLFATLQSPPTSEQSSRSIYALCSTNRAVLISELSNFIAQYEAFIRLPHAETFAIERVSGAIGVLLQALPNLSDTINGTMTLLNYVRNGVVSAKELILQGNPEAGNAVASKSMKCLSAIAKSLQEPDDMIVEIDDDEEEKTPGELDAGTKEQLQQLQSQIFEIVSMTLEAAGHDGEIIDDICQVFKSGFTEPVNSPFHFAPDIVLQFFCISTTASPHLVSYLRMGCAFLRSLKVKDESTGNVTSSLAQHMASLIESLPDLRADTEITQAIIDMLIRFMPHHTNSILALQPVSRIESVLGFTIASIELPDVLPKRSALSFWVSGAVAQSSSADMLQNNFLELPPTPLLTEVVTHYGAALSAAFARQIGGNATRQDLDHLVGPMKKLMRRHPSAKPWLEDALIHKVPENARVDAAAKRRLVQQLGMTNTQRGTKDIVLAFWNASRGVSGSYNPLR